MLLKGNEFLSVKTRFTLLSTTQAAFIVKYFTIKSTLELKKLVEDKRWKPEKKDLKMKS